MLAEEERESACWGEPTVSGDEIEAGEVGAGDGEIPSGEVLRVHEEDGVAPVTLLSHLFQNLRKKYRTY